MSINAILYTPGGKYWAMTERGRACLERTATRIAIGPSALSWQRDGLVIDVDEWTAPLPKRLRGRITVEPGPLFSTAYALDQGGSHHWQPIAPCATATIALERPALAWQGHAYIDMNSGSEPLEQGFRSWNWSRQTTGTATRILYDVEHRDGGRRHLALDYRHQGSVESFAPPPAFALPRTGWRVSRATRADPQHPIRILRTLEDTPFYSRSLLGCGGIAAPASSMHESVDLDRFRSRWVQTLLPFKMPRRAR